MTAPIWKISDSATSPVGRAVADERGRAGFTLLELLLAISLMGLILGMAVPRFSAVRTQYFAEESERGLVNSVRSARVSAIRWRTPVALTVAGDNGSRLEERRLPPRSWSEAEPEGCFRKVADWETVWDAPIARTYAAGGAIELQALEEGIVFFPNGTSTGGRITVTDVDGKVVSMLMIDPHTSEVLTK